MNGFKINNTSISSNSQTYFIADIAASHDGDKSRAIDLIYSCAEKGANAAKFQHFEAETIVSDKGFKSLGKQKSHQSEWKKSVYDVYKEASLPFEWTEDLKKAADKAGIDFFTSPYSFDLVDKVEEFVCAYKIGSGDLTWHQIIEHIAKKNLPYILATGASDLDEVKKIVKKCLLINKKFCLMQCNTNYTASNDNFKYIQLNVLKNFKKEFPEVILGLSDHTPGHSTVLGAVALGAKMIEKHYTDDNERIGPDHAFSMNPKSWKEMILRTRELELSLGSEVKKVEKNEIDTVILQRRSIRLIKNKKKGEKLTSRDISFLRPCPKDSIQPYDEKKIIGKKLKVNLSKDDHLKWTHLELE